VYRPGPGATIPGDDSRHVAVFDGIRVVFSFTQTKAARYRHLSASLTDRRDALPNPVVVQEIAKEYGFTGTLLDWQADIRSTHVALLQQVATIV